jgi:translocation and assembly module TamB
MQRRLKLTAWVLGAILTLALILVAGLWIAGNTESGRALIVRLTDRFTGGEVKLIGLGGSFPSSLTLDELQLSDAHGVWLTAQHIAVDWSPLAMLRWDVRVAKLRAARLAIERGRFSASTSGGVSIPHIEIGDALIDVVELGAPLVGTRSSLAVRGHGELRTLEDANADVTATRIGGEGRYELHFRFDTRHMDATLKVQEPAGGPLENLLQLPGLGALAATASWQGPRNAERLDVQVDAGELHARVHGSVDLSSRKADLDYGLEASAMQPRPDLAWRRIALAGSWHGSLTAPSAQGKLDVESLQLPGSVSVTGIRAALTGSAGGLALDGTIDGLRIPGPAPGLLQADPIRVLAKLRLDESSRPLSVTASSRLFSLDGQANTVGKLSAVLNLRLPDIAPLTAMAGEPLGGSAVLKGQFTSDSGGLRVAIDANAALAAAPSSLRALLGDRVQLRVSGDISDRVVRVQELRLNGQYLLASLDGSAKRADSGALDSLEARWKVDVSNLGALATPLAGELRASGRVGGALTALDLDAESHATLSVHGSASGTLTGELHAHGLPREPTASLRLGGMLDGAPLKLKVTVARNAHGVLQAAVHEADWKTAHAEGAVAIGATLAQTHGHFEFGVANLSDFAHLLGVNADGRLAGQLEFAPTAGQTRAKIHVAATDFLIGQFRGDADLTGSGVSSAVRLRLGMHLPDWRGSALSLGSAGVLDLDGHKLRIDSADLVTHEQTVRLLAPATFSFANGLSVDQWNIGARQANLQIAGKLFPALDLHVAVRNVRPALVNVFDGGLLTAGNLSAETDLQGPPTAPTGVVQVDAVGLRFAGDAATALPSLEIHGTVQLQGDNSFIDSSLTAGSDSMLKVFGHAPLDLGGPLDLTIAGKLDVGLISPVLEARGQQAAGRLDVDTTVTGSTDAPVIGGTVKLSKGSLRDYGRGLSLSDMAAAISGTDGALKIDSFTARAETGTFSMTGSVGALQPGIPVDLHLTAVNAQPVTSTLITANINSELHLAGLARERLDLDGKINVNRATIGIPNSLPPNVAVLDVRRRGQKASSPPEPALVIGLNIAVHAPREVLVKGRGLDAELGGDLQISGTTDAPVVEGALNLLRGTFSIVGNTLTFNTGRVSFDGADPKNKLDPSLDFTAQTVLSDTTATLTVTGLATAPRFDFSSSPYLPQDQILSSLLFGVQPSQLSAVQVAQIGAALAILSGVGGDGSYNPIVYLQKTLGLDRLTVGADQTTPGTSNAGYSIAAGRYIAKRIYVEAKQSTTGASQVQVDVELTKHLTLQTRLGDGTAITQGTTPENDPGSSIGLKYQIEY